MSKNLKAKVSKQANLQKVFTNSKAGTNKENLAATTKILPILVPTTVGWVTRQTPHSPLQFLEKLYNY